MSRLILRALAGAACLLFLAASLHAQSSATATILGSVLDPQSALVPGATVVARNVETGIARTTVTTSGGLYRIPNLAPGTYDLETSAPGFATAEVKGIHLLVGDQEDVDFSLVLGTTSQEVKVGSSVPLVEISRTDVSSVVDEKSMASLPVSEGGLGPSNDYLQLAITSPAVRIDPNFGFLGPGAYNNHSNAFNVDGGNITDQVGSGRTALGATLDEVQEFQVLTSSYDAEYGQAGSLVVNVITKSGTNQFHGNAHAYFRGRNLAASDFFYNLTPEAAFRRAPFQKQEEGVVAGGPLIRDRTFWFLSFEKTHEASTMTLTSLVPVNISVPLDEIVWSVKLDHQLNANHLLSARFNVQRQSFDNQAFAPPFADPESLAVQTGHDHTLNIALTSTLTAQTTNEARFFWHRFLSNLLDKTTQPGQLGANFYHGAAICCPQGGLQQRYQFIDNLSWSHGNHALKTGFNISHFPFSSLFQQFHFGLYKGFPNPAPNPGLPTQFEIGLGPGTVSSTDNIYGFFAQDSWKLSRNLTLNYGLRYDVEAGAFQGGPIPDRNVPGGCLQGNGLIPACSSDHNNFQPRLGLAWSPDFHGGFLRWLFGDANRSVIRAAAGEFTELAFLNLALDSLNADGVELFTITITDPSVLKFFPNRPPASAIAPFVPVNRTFFGEVRPISNHLRNPEFRHFSLSATRQLGNDFALDLGYIGVLGFGQFGERDTNAPPVLPDPSHPGFFYFGSRPNPHFDAVRTNENSRTSAYHGFTAHITKRTSHHVEFQASYTFSKTLSSTEDFFGISEPGDVRNIRVERSLSQSDLRHIGKFSVVLDTQQLFRQSVLSHTLNNWTIGLIGQIHAVRPYPISTGDVPFFTSFFPSLGGETQQRPNILPDGTLVATNIAGAFGTNLLVGPNGAAACGCPQTTFLAPPAADPGGSIDSFTGDVVDFQYVNGNLGRNVGVTSGFYDLEASLAKSFTLHDRLRVELRADFFNLFNHPNFIGFNGVDTLNALPLSKNPNCRSCLNAQTGFYIGSSGQRLKLQDLRHGRVSRDLQKPVFAGLGDPTADVGPRQIQLVIRIHW
jgi:hypothetical protein